LARWRNPFSQLSDEHGVNDVRQTEIQRAEPLVPEPNAFEVEIDVEKLKDTNHWVLIKFRQNSIKQGVEQFALRSINLLILSGIRRNCLRSGRSQSLCLSTRRVIKQIVVITGAYNFCQLCVKLYPTSCCQG